MRERNTASLLMRIGGIALLLIGLSHFLVPRLFRWREAFVPVKPVYALGEQTQNTSFLYLFNADLLLYETMLGLLSLYFAKQIRKGKTSAAVFSLALGAFFILRTPLQFFYFPPSPVNVAQTLGSLTLAVLYCYPILHLKESFAES
ncbi:MAG: hypothetical protein L0338_30540 [Acidobacteria bacterium]|nr:hypothetical protein [Acidobacteriota bacterium]